MTKKRELKVGRAEAADYLGIAVGRLNKMVDEKKIHPEIAGSGEGGRTHFRFTVAELDRVRKMMVEEEKAAKVARLAKKPAKVRHIDDGKLITLTQKLDELEGILQSIDARLNNIEAAMTAPNVANHG